MVASFDCVICLTHADTAYHDRASGEHVTDLKKIRDQYLAFWFPIDLVATIPLEWPTYIRGIIDESAADDAGASSFSLLSLLRMLKMLKLFRMFRLARYLKVITEVVQFNPSAKRFFFSILTLLVFWHFIGCTYWYIASSVIYGGIGPCDHNNTCIFNSEGEFRCGKFQVNADGGPWCFYEMCRATGTCDFMMQDEHVTASLLDLHTNANLGWNNTGSLLSCVVLDVFHSCSCRHAHRLSLCHTHNSNLSSCLFF